MIVIITWGNLEYDNMLPTRVLGLHVTLDSNEPSNGVLHFVLFAVHQKTARLIRLDRVLRFSKEKMSYGSSLNWVLVNIYSTLILI